jgi:hypothetical protein
MYVSLKSGKTRKSLDAQSKPDAQSWKRGSIAKVTYFPEACIGLSDWPSTFGQVEWYVKRRNRSLLDSALPLTQLSSRYLPYILQVADCPLDRNALQDTPAVWSYSDSSNLRDIAQGRTVQGMTENLCIY